METFTKIEDKLEIAPEAIVQETITKTLEELSDDLRQAQDSLVYVQQRHADEIAPIQATIDLMKKRLDEAIKLGIVAVEVLKKEVNPITK